MNGVEDKSRCRKKKPFCIRILLTLISILKHKYSHRAFLIAVFFLIIMFAGYNYISASSNISASYDSVLSILQNLYTLNNKCINHPQIICDESSISAYQQYLSSIDKHIDETYSSLKQIVDDMDNNKKGLFDANTITFLVSFGLAGIIALFLDNDRRTTDKLKEMNSLKTQLKTLSKEYDQKLIDFKEDIGEKQKVIQLINNFQMIHLIAIQISIEISKNPIEENGPINEYCRTIDVEIAHIIHSLNKGEYNNIPVDIKPHIFSEMLKIQGLISSSNIVQEGLILVPLISCQQNLQELINRISIFKLEITT